MPTREQIRRGRLIFMHLYRKVSATHFGVLQYLRNAKLARASHGLCSFRKKRPSTGERELSNAPRRGWGVRDCEKLPVAMNFLSSPYYSCLERPDTGSRPHSQKWTYPTLQLWARPQRQSPKHEH